MVYVVLPHAEALDENSATEALSNANGELSSICVTPSMQSEQFASSVILVELARSRK